LLKNIFGKFCIGKWFLRSRNYLLKNRAQSTKYKVGIKKENDFRSLFLWFVLTILWMYRRKQSFSDYRL
jgi:hypothetical protein